jgi:hypothetical protein
MYAGSQATAGRAADSEASEAGDAQPTARSPPHPRRGGERSAGLSAVPYPAATADADACDNTFEARTSQVRHLTSSCIRPTDRPRAV